MSSLSPLIAAGSALAGGVVSTFGQIGVEWSRGRREREREEATARRELRQSVRLVIEELAECLGLIADAARTRRYWVGTRTLPTSTWNHYEPDIAAAIEGSLDWRFVTAAYDGINNLNWKVDHRRRTSGDSTGHVIGFEIEVYDQTRDTWIAVRRAIETLEQTIDITGPASRVIRARHEVIEELWPHGDGADFDEESARQADWETSREEAMREAQGRY